MNPLFNRVTIVGVGLLGASLGLALKARGLAGRVIGVGHRQISIDTALHTGAVDEAFLELPPALKDTDLVVLATPAALVIPKLNEIRPLINPETLVTDVASTKAAICEHAKNTWPTPRRFIGSHPMAGSERFGPEHGDKDFYVGAVTLVEKNDGLDAAAHDAIRELWRAVGASIIDIDPVEHDALLARTSHLPHIVSSVLATLAVRQGDIRSVIGNGFRDMTRIAGSRPELWRDICLTNRPAILDALAELEQDLQQFSKALRDEDDTLIFELFQQGKTARKKAVDS